jgi:alpha-mannosidase
MRGQISPGYTKVDSAMNTKHPTRRNGARSSAGKFSRHFGLSIASAAMLLPVCAAGQTMQAPDITKNPTLYVVPYAHLDTQWRWEMPQTISEYLLKTMRVNFDYIDRYPHYVFNWTGSNRYRLMKEYYPDDYARVKQYVAAGRWFPAGSSVEEGDVNLPSAEGIFRQVLYGNAYFRKDFGKASDEYMLPDCFGFPASLPSILAHAGVKGFSTQKLSAVWQPSPMVGGPDSPEKTPEGIPFNVGLWTGPDGKTVIAALNPGSYNSNTYTDLSKEPPPVSTHVLTAQEKAKLTPLQIRQYERRQIEPDWVQRIDLDGKVTGIFADYHYVGTGDIGGATQESTVKLLEAIVTKSETVLPVPPQLSFLKESSSYSPTPVRVGEGPVHVIEAAADQMFHDMATLDTSRLPGYKGDLELINHSAGSLTSEAYHKRWIMRNESLANAAEEASLAAEWLGARPYPRQRLVDAWTLELGGHFHDTGAGTATPQTYRYAWNDDAISANLFGGVITSATEAVASSMNTQGPGVPVVLFNPLNVEREDLVEATVAFLGAMPSAVRVIGPDDSDAPGQIANGKVLFVAKAPSVGYAVYHVVPAQSASAGSALKVTTSTLENARYRVQINPAGDIASVFDKQLNRELLSAPMRLAITTDTPKQYPAWNMDYEQVEAAPRAYVSGPAKVRIVESGPVRVALEVSRETEGSTFVQTISLSAGDVGNRVEVRNAIDWRGLTSNLKVAFPLSATNSNATYNQDLGTIERPTATRAPGAYSDQANQDWGHHEITFGLVGHAGGWREAQTDWQAYRLNDPMMPFSTEAHAGSLGKSFSLLHIDNARIRVFALKKAEDSDEIVLRAVEMDGKPASSVHFVFASPVAAARELNGQEQPIGPAETSHGQLVTSFSPYQPRTFALKLGATEVRAAAIRSQPVKLPYTLAVATDDDTKTPGGGFDGHGNALPAEMLPAQIDYNGVTFTLAAAGAANALVPNGQSLTLPSGHSNRVYILAASADGDQRATFNVGSQAAELTVQDWGGFIGQWDTRLWKNEPHPDWSISAHHAVWPPNDFDDRERWPPSPTYPDDYVGLEEGFIKPASLAWYASHHHTADGLNAPYQYSYLFAYALAVPADAHTLTLPKNDKIRILAVSAVEEIPPATPAEPLFDTLGSTSNPKLSR